MFIGKFAFPKSEQSNDAKRKNNFAKLVLVMVKEKKVNSLLNYC